MATKKTTNTEKKEALDFVQGVMNFMKDEPCDAGCYDIKIIAGGKFEEKDVTVVFPDGVNCVYEFSYTTYKEIFKNMIETVKNALSVSGDYENDKANAFFTAGDGKKCKLLKRSFIEDPCEIINQIDGFRSGDTVEAISRCNLTRESIYETGKSMGFIVFYVAIKYKKQGIDNDINQWFRVNVAIEKKQKKSGKVSPLHHPKGVSL